MSFKLDIEKLSTQWPDYSEIAGIIIVDELGLLLLSIWMDTKVKST